MIDIEKLNELLDSFSTPVMLGDVKLMDWTIPTEHVRDDLVAHLIANGVRLNTRQATSDKTSDDPMTYADKIRAMDDETLASQLVKVFEEGVLALTDIPIPYEILNEVRSEFLKKLKEPVEEQNECQRETD